MAAGLLLLLAASALSGYNLWDDRRAGRAAGEALEELSDRLDAAQEEKEGPETDPAEREVPDYILDPEMEMPTVEIGGREYIGVLEIPALDLSLPVMGEWSYPNLKTAPCRYSGTAYKPGFVIAGHNYRTHFSPIKNIAMGEDVFFTDVDGNRFAYETAEAQVLEPAAVEEMTADSWDLTLFTCTYGGGSRLAVRCEAVPASGWAGEERHG